MNKTGMLARNEAEANESAARIMLYTEFFVLLLFFLNLAGVFSVPFGTMALAMGITAVLLLVPAAIVFVFKIQEPWVKYTITVTATLAVFMTFALLSHNVVLLYIYPLAIACLYFSKSLSVFTSAFSLVALSAAQVLGLSMGVPDNNLNTSAEMFFRGIVPRGLQFLVISAVFIFLASRTGRMLENVMGA